MRANTPHIHGQRKIDARLTCHTFTSPISQTDSAGDATASASQQKVLLAHQFIAHLFHGRTMSPSQLAIYSERQDTRFEGKKSYIIYQYGARYLPSQSPAAVRSREQAYAAFDFGAFLRFCFNSNFLANV